MKRINVLGCPMDVATMSQTIELIKASVLRNEFMQHVVVNVAKIVNMRKDPELADSVTQCDVINIDGMGVVWGARILGHHVPERVAGVDLFYELNAMAEKESFPVFYLGAKQEVVDETKMRMQKKHPSLNVVGTQNGYFWGNEQGVVEQIKASGAKLLFVAITSPKKENFINKWKDDLGVNFVMGVGGTFDVVAGRVERAPKWMQSAGLEWLFRVIQEPRRMWKRYLVTNSQFLFLLLKSKFFEKK